MEIALFERSYRTDTPPWVTGRPQPAVVALAAEGRFTGHVLDVGCGTGENACHLASLGLRVTGVDGAESPVSTARATARARGVEATFTVADAFALTDLGHTYDSVLDSAFLHTLREPGERATYAGQLASVLAPGGWAHLLQISEHSEGCPSLTRAEIIGAFGDAWSAVRINETVYDTSVGHLSAWQVSVRRR